MKKRAFGAVIGSVVMAVALAGCGGGGDDSDSVGAGGGATTALNPPSTEPSAELPPSAGGFDRVCTTQVGFPGAKTYEPTPGVVHKMVFFEEYRGENFVDTGDFPQGWVVKNDDKYTDNSEFKAVELIACADRVKETPNGTQCEFEDDGKKIKLELVDTVHELKVYAATTGKVVAGPIMIEAASKECPYIAAFQKGDTKYWNTPSDDQYINALKPTVAP